MKILLPPVFRFLALLFCAAALIIPAPGIAGSYPFFETNKYLLSSTLLWSGLLLFAFAGKPEYRERWTQARRKSARFTLLQLVILIPVMAFFLKEEGAGLKWPSLTHVITMGLLYFAGFTNLYFYTEKKVLPVS